MGLATPPIGICTGCKTPISNSILLNERCDRRFDGVRCNGVYRGALDYADWKRCETCAGSGLHPGKKRCDECHGNGWQYVGKSRER
jgi:hypothetical protein